MEHVPPGQITIRWCPECGGTKVVDRDEFALCEGPHMGPFPTDRSHKATVTVQAIYTLALYEREPGESPDRKRRERRARWP